MKKDGSDFASTYRKKTTQIRGCEKCGLNSTVIGNIKQKKALNFQSNTQVGVKKREKM